jgi:hypothetical protein
VFTLAQRFDNEGEVEEGEEEDIEFLEAGEDASEALECCFSQSVSPFDQIICRDFSH